MKNKIAQKLQNLTKKTSKSYKKNLDKTYDSRYNTIIEMQV